MLQTMFEAAYRASAVLAIGCMVALIVVAFTGG